LVDAANGRGFSVIEKILKTSVLNWSVYVVSAEELN
jgi:hypothetical protein